MSVKILPIKTFLSKVFLGTKYVEKVERKVGKTVFQNIKNLTNHNSNITKFRSCHYKGFCEINALENYAQSLKRLVKEFNI